MQMTAGQVFKELDGGKWHPFYLILGEESFQAGEVLSRLKAFFIRDEVSASFNFESWDGEHLDAPGLLSSLDTLPGLFDVGAESLRLVLCSRFEKVPAGGLEVLEKYFRNPSPSTCFLIQAEKADKRKSWFKAVDGQGVVVEVHEPHDREWPRWHGYFERKLKQKIEADAWERLLETSGRSLSLLWSELQKVSLFVGGSAPITGRDVMKLAAEAGEGDVFDFVADVVSGRPLLAMDKYYRLVRFGESEIKLLALLVRQFRQVQHCQELMKKGITDNKALSSQIGAHPFFLSKVQQQAKGHSVESLAGALALLSECDYRMKTGEGGLFEGFLIPYFGQLRARG